MIEVFDYATVASAGPKADLALAVVVAAADCRWPAVKLDRRTGRPSWHSKWKLRLCCGLAKWHRPDWAALEAKVACCWPVRQAVRQPVHLHKRSRKHSQRSILDRMVSEADWLLAVESVPEWWWSW